jgi:hypothetical protein
VVQFTEQRQRADLAAVRRRQAAQGFDDVAALLTAPGVRRVIVTGNGAQWHVALALWLAWLQVPEPPVEVLAVPGGLVARGAFPWRNGDRLLALSSSGEFRDVIEAIRAGAPRPIAAIIPAAKTAVSPIPEPPSRGGRAAPCLGDQARDGVGALPPGLARVHEEVVPAVGAVLV